MHSFNAHSWTLIETILCLTVYRLWEFEDGNLSWIRLRPSLQKLSKEGVIRMHMIQPDTRQMVVNMERKEKLILTGGWSGEHCIKDQQGDLTGGPVVRTPCFQCRAHAWSTGHVAGKKKKKAEDQQCTTQRQMNLPCRQGLRQRVHNSFTGIRLSPTYSGPMGKRQWALLKGELQGSLSFYLKNHTKFEFHSTGY